MLKIITPESYTHLQQIRTLSCEFVEWLRRHHSNYLSVINEYFEGKEFKKELDNLPERYAPPEGRFLLALKSEYFLSL